MARTRTVFGTHANLAHTWAQQSFSVGYSADRRMFFEGDTIYSYGRHYPMARFTSLVDAKGYRVVLFKDDGYSVSTAKHRNHTSSALRGLNVQIWYVADINASVGTNADAMMSHVASAVERLSNPCAQKGVDLSSRLVELENRVQGVRDFLSLYTHDDDASAVERCNARLAFLHAEAVAAITRAMTAFNDPAKVAKRAVDKRKRDTAKAVGLINETLTTLADGREPASSRCNVSYVSEALELWLASGRTIEPVQPIIHFLQQCLAIREQEALASVIDPNAAQVLTARRWASYESKPAVTPERWLEGEGDAAQYNYGWGWREHKTLVRRKGDRLETSRGAEVPFKHAVAAYLKAQQCRERGTTWHRNGEKVAVGVYQLDAIDAEGNIRAGCHTIAFAEMQRLAIREVPHLVRASFPVPALIAA